MKFQRIKDVCLGATVAALVMGCLLYTSMAESYFKVDEALVELAQEAAKTCGLDCRIITGRVASGDQFIATQEARDKIRKTVKGEDVYKRQLPKYPLLLLEDLSNSRRCLDKYARENGVELNPILELGSSDLLVSFAKINLGLTFVIREFTEEALSSGGLYEIPLVPPVPKRQIGMVRLKEVAMPHALRGFVELMGLDKNDIDK